MAPGLTADEFAALPVRDVDEVLVRLTMLCVSTSNEMPEKKDTPKNSVPSLTQEQREARAQAFADRTARAAVVNLKAAARARAAKGGI